MKSWCKGTVFFWYTQIIYKKKHPCGCFFFGESGNWFRRILFLSQLSALWP